MELSGWWELVQQVLTEEFYREEEKLSRTYAKCDKTDPACPWALRTRLCPGPVVLAARLWTSTALRPARYVAGS